MKIKYTIFKILVFLTIATLVGCASGNNSTDDAKKIAQLTIKIETGTETNLDSKGRANPILIRIYELKNPSTFEQLDYFSLQDKDRILLGNDLIAKDEFIMRPEEQKIIEKILAKDTEAIGIMAAYQDLSKATWRKVYRIDRKKESRVLPAWSQKKQKIKLAIDLYGYDMILFDEEMNRF